MDDARRVMLAGCMAPDEMRLRSRCQAAGLEVDITPTLVTRVTPWKALYEAVSLPGVEEDMLRRILSHCGVRGLYGVTFDRSPVMRVGETLVMHGVYDEPVLVAPQMPTDEILRECGAIPMWLPLPFQMPDWEQARHDIQRRIEDVVSRVREAAAARRAVQAG